MSAIGPSRYFARAQQLDRFRREADIGWQAGPAGKVANDPKLTWSSFQRPYQRWNFTTRTGVWLIEIGHKHFPRSLADAGDLSQV
jgi:hypothetical protein